MNISQIKIVEDNLAGLRQMAVEILNENEPDALELATYINDACTNIEEAIYLDS